MSTLDQLTTGLTRLRQMVASEADRWTFYPPPGDTLVFFTEDRDCVVLSSRAAPDIESDRDRAVLRAFLQLTLKRLDEMEG